MKRHRCATSSGVIGPLISNHSEFPASILADAIAFLKASTTANAESVLGSPVAAGKHNHVFQFNKY